MAIRPTVTLTGTDMVLSNLNAQLARIKGRTAKGLHQAALLVERRAQEKTPVDTGNLKASSYTEPLDTPKGPGEEIGYTAFYAPYVHENLEASHRVGEAKFLEKALYESEQDILQIVAANARII